jgi:ABC-type multidrug transport system ATPase subunit
MMRTLKGFGLLGKKWEKVYNLSLGEKLLLMLARATIVDQPLLLLDEPLAGLDPEMSARISALIVKMSVAGHSMMIMTTGQTRLHVPRAAEYSLENGRIR